EVRSQNEQLLEVQALLEQSRDRYLDLYDLAPIGYMTLDEFGVILEINLPGADLLGRERSRLVGMPFLSHVLQTDRRGVLDHLRHIREDKGLVSLDVALRENRGRVRHVRLQSRSLSFDSRGRCVLIAIVDRTEQARMEEALGASEERLRIAVDVAGGA